jgi:hypothetical protein
MVEHHRLLGSRTGFESPRKAWRPDQREPTDVPSAAQAPAWSARWSRHAPSYRGQVRPYSVDVAAPDAAHPDAIRLGTPSGHACDRPPLESNARTDHCQKPPAQQPPRPTRLAAPTTRPREIKILHPCRNHTMQLVRNGIADVGRPAWKRTDGCHGFSRYSVNSHSAQPPSRLSRVPVIPPNE